MKFYPLKDGLDSKTLRSLQMKGLEILLYFKEFCDKHGLLFYFCGGCCIGALRHNGFIPWDDDVDVFMPRKDYEKLYKLWNNNADIGKYSCLRTTKERFSGHIFTTIVDNNTTLIKPTQKNLDIPHGVTIDVFPLDGCPSKKIKRKIQMLWALLYSLYLAQLVPQNHGKFVKYTGKLLLCLVPGKNMRYKIWRLAEKQMSKYSISECKYITELCAGPGYMKNEYPKEIFDSAVLKEFEGYNLPIPVGYNRYLRIAFGDYMSLPPKEKRVPHHDILFLDLENSYKKYKNIHYNMEDK